MQIDADGVVDAGDGKQAVITHYGYSRQERKAAPREPITAKLVADLLSVAGIDNAICIYSFYTLWLILQKLLITSKNTFLEGNTFCF